MVILMIISTSLLGVINDLEKIENIDHSKTDLVHIDVMDGKFVKNNTNFLHLSGLEKKIDIHFMVENIQEYIDKYLYLHPLYMTFHIEATNCVEEIIDYIHNRGVKAGIAISPHTHLETLLPYLDKIDLILLMSVVPGFGGQAFLKSTTSRLKNLKKWKEEGDYSFQIEVDGGINDQTAFFCKDADILVIGSFITRYKNLNERICLIQEKF